MRLIGRVTKRLWKPAAALLPAVWAIWKLIDIVWGVPSRLSDIGTWSQWIDETPIIWQVGAATVILLMAAVIATWDLWYPKIRASRTTEEFPDLRRWTALDGSITIEQAAFLWAAKPMQTPTPAEVQSKLRILQNAINQGALRRHTRYSIETEQNFAVARLLLGHPTPPDTRVMPAELKRWFEGTGSVPEFLGDVCAAQAANPEYEVTQL